MIEQTLHLMGLNDKEVLVYLNIVRLGTTTASSIARRTGLKRSTALYNCQQLHSKGFIRSIEKNGAFNYSPEPPEKLLMILDLQKREIAKKERCVLQCISELEAMIHPEADIPKVRFYQGIDGLIGMFEDVLKVNEDICGALQLDKNTHPAILDYIFNDYMPRRVKGGIHARMLFNDSPITREYQKQDKKMRRVSLLIPEEQFPFSACFHLYSNKVAYYSYKKTDLTGVIIENNNIYQTAYSIFQMAWSLAQTGTYSKDNKHI